MIVTEVQNGPACWFRIPTEALPTCQVEKVLVGGSEPLGHRLQGTGPTEMISKRSWQYVYTGKQLV